MRIVIGEGDGSAAGVVDGSAGDREGAVAECGGTVDIQRAGIEGSGSIVGVRAGESESVVAGLGDPCRTRNGTSDGDVARGGADGRPDVDGKVGVDGLEVGGFVSDGAYEGQRGAAAGARRACAGIERVGPSSRGEGDIGDSGERSVADVVRGRAACAGKNKVVVVDWNSVFGPIAARIPVARAGVPSRVAGQGGVGEADRAAGGV